MGFEGVPATGAGLAWGVFADWVAGGAGDGYSLCPPVLGVVEIPARVSVGVSLPGELVWVWSVRACGVFVLDKLG